MKFNDLQKDTVLLMLQKLDDLYINIVNSENVNNTDKGDILKKIDDICDLFQNYSLK